MVQSERTPPNNSKDASSLEHKRQAQPQNTHSASAEQSELNIVESHQPMPVFSFCENKVLRRLLLYVEPIENVFFFFQKIGFQNRLNVLNKTSDYSL